MDAMWGSGLIWAVIRNPRLWGEALRTLVAVSPRDWWRRRPLVPRPEPQYAAWRLTTAYGSQGEQFLSHDFIEFLEWRRRYRAATSGRHAVTRGVSGG